VKFVIIVRDEVVALFETNAAGSLSVTQEFLPMVRASKYKKVLCTSSNLGSISRTLDGGYTAYRMSKAALNMAMRVLATDPDTKDVGPRDSL